MHSPLSPNAVSSAALLPCTTPGVLFFWRSRLASSSSPGFHFPLQLPRRERPLTGANLRYQVKLPCRAGTAPDSSWVTYSSLITRLDSGPHQQLEKSVQEGMGRSHMSHSWLLQLFMALECDAWIGTRNSNWNRLIDELRCVMVSKCHAPYIEVGDRKDWENYHWR